MYLNMILYHVTINKVLPFYLTLYLEHLHASFCQCLHIQKKHNIKHHTLACTGERLNPTAYSAGDCIFYIHVRRMMQGRSRHVWSGVNRVRLPGKVRPRIFRGSHRDEEGAEGGRKEKFDEEKLESEQQMTLLLIFLGPKGPLRTPLVPVVRCWPWNLRRSIHPPNFLLFLSEM